VRRERPSVAVSVGGYAAGPAILAAWLSGVPTIVMEPNAVPGLTNKLLGKLAQKAISPYERARTTLARKFIRAGIPVRPQIAAGTIVVRRTHTASHLGVWRFAGARAINDVVVRCAPQW